MVTYKYTAVSKSGATVSGVIEGFNEMDAVSRIRQSCDIVLKITEVKDRKQGILNFELGGSKLDNKAFTVMCSQFATILRAGLPISRTVHLIADKTTDKTLKKILNQVAEDVEAGHTMASSLEERGGKIFPTTFIETVRAGEESGNMHLSFDAMYKHFDKQVKMAGKVRGALAYPIFVMVLAVIVVIVLMVKVVPTFTAILSSYGAELPLPTKMLIAISDFFTKYWMVLLVVGVVLFFAYKFFGATENGRMLFSKIALKVPVLGNITELNAASQFANTMTMMLEAGISLPRSISITSRVLDNYYISQEVGKMTVRLEEGHSLGDSMRDSGCMPDILTDMTAVGEETGEMAETLSNTALYYDAELEMAIADALAKLEPTLLVFMAGVAGFIVVSIYLAMFQMYGAM